MLEVLGVVCGDAETSLAASVRALGGPRSTIGMCLFCDAKGEDIDGRESSAPGMIESCIAIAREVEVDARRASGRDGWRRTVFIGGGIFVVELGRRLGSCPEGSEVPILLDPDSDLARKAERYERGEGGEVDIEGWKRGSAEGVMGKEDEDEVGDRGTAIDGVRGKSAVSGLSPPSLFLRSSSSRFFCSSSCVCILRRIASCSIISSASSLVIRTIPSTRLPTLLGSLVPPVPVPDPFVA